nr:MAG TPA: hypothetical protein [Caudoviricetes sp.]
MKNVSSKTGETEIIRLHDRKNGLKTHSEQMGFRCARTEGRPAPVVGLLDVSLSSTRRRSLANLIRREKGYGTV